MDFHSPNISSFNIVRVDPLNPKFVLCKSNSPQVFGYGCFIPDFYRFVKFKPPPVLGKQICSMKQELSLRLVFAGPQVGSTQPLYLFHNLLWKNEDLKICILRMIDLTSWPRI